MPTANHTTTAHKETNIEYYERMVREFEASAAASVGLAREDALHHAQFCRDQLAKERALVDQINRLGRWSS